MKTDHLIKALVAIIILTVVTLIYPVRTEALTNLKQIENSKEELLEIKPVQMVNKKSSDELKIEIDIEELKKIREEKRKAEELQRQKEEEERRLEEERRKAEEAQKIVYDGLTLEELTNKLNRSLNSTISGKGDIFAKYSVELGINPYLAVAIVMHESGCKWSCSGLLNTCNNVGGMKGAGGCGGGEYAYFPTLDDGIIAYMNNLYRNYFSQGLTTPEAMGPKYAASTTWAAQVRNYMNEIEAN